MCAKILLFCLIACVVTPLKSKNLSTRQGTLSPTDTFTLGNCKIVINRICPDPDVTFYLFSKSHPKVPEGVRIGADPGVSNLTKTSFNSQVPTKIIVHGYNSDMNLNVLVELRTQYLAQNNFNVFTVDWSPLSQGPCYPAAVWNIKHVGLCTSQLVQRIKELGAKDIHLIGFSLGAQLTNYVSTSLAPEYKLPRITGLDPAGPGFITVGPDRKLDKSDAHFVDVYHTNAFVQGIVEESGHVDFYLNGGVIQPGCWAENRFFACNHHRAPQYFAESINTQVGFWGWPCPSYGEYLVGRCPPKEPQVIMGEHINSSFVEGVHLVITDSVSPFAVGKYTGPAIEILLKSELARLKVLEGYKSDVLNFIDEDDLIESLQSLQRYKKISDDVVEGQIKYRIYETLAPAVDLVL